MFALVLFFFPKGSEEWMRWWSLLGTAVTLVAEHVHVHRLLHACIDLNLDANWKKAL